MKTAMIDHQSYHSECAVLGAQICQDTRAANQFIAHEGHTHIAAALTL